MNRIRKSSDARQRELELAIYRIERGRAHTKENKLSISAVAREAGVTPALIHNHYPSIAEAIRVKLRSSAREQRSKKDEVIKELQVKNQLLRKEIDEIKSNVAKLASINETLLTENRTLKAKASSPNVVDITP